MNCGSNENRRYEFTSVLSFPNFPCDVGGRFRRFAFTTRDEARDVTLELDSIGRVMLMVNGQLVRFRANDFEILKLRRFLNYFLITSEDRY